jgi:hypothetical protein
MLSLLAIGACDTDTVIDSDRSGDGDAPPDGSMMPADGAGRPIPDASLDPVCDEAKLHADFAWIQANVFTPSCATAMCHGGTDPAVGLSLAAGAAYNNLVNKGTSTVTGWKRVVPGSIAQSYLAVALGRAAGPAPRDGFMPLGAGPLCVGKLEALERWITAGAPP